MPAETGDPLGERLDHRWSHHRQLRVAEGEANPPNAPVIELLQLRVGDGRPEDGHASGIFGAELSDRIHRGSVIDDIRAWCYDHHARGAVPLLQHSILRHAPARGRRLGIWSERKTFGIL